MSDPALGRAAADHSRLLQEYPAERLASLPASEWTRELAWFVLLEGMRGRAGYVGLIARANRLLDRLPRQPERGR